MVTSARRSGDPYRQACAALAERLRERFGEIEHTIMTRIRAVGPFDGESDPEYVNGLRRAVHAAIEYCLDAIKEGIEHGPPIPTDLIVQARIASRHNIKFSTVMHRHHAGSSQVRAFVIEEASRDKHLQGAALGQLLEELDAALERLLIELEHEYSREPQDRLDSSDARLLRRVERRLAGEPIDLGDLNYDFNGHHLGGVTQGGQGVMGALHALGKVIDGRLLPIRVSENVTWAWIATRQPLDRRDLERCVASSWPASIALALGEPGSGFPGWRLTHEQAKVASTIAFREPPTAIHYADVALTTAIERDPVALITLRQLYLAPLRQRRDGGEILCNTLRAYFKAQRNLSSTAAALGVARRTVSNRLALIESLVRRPIDEILLPMEVALQLEDQCQSITKTGPAYCGSA